MSKELTPEMIEAMNLVMTEPIRQMAASPHIRVVRLRVKPEPDRQYDVEVERYDHPTRYYWEAAPVEDGEGFRLSQWDAPVDAYADPEEAFWAAVMWVEDQQQAAAA